MVPFLFILYYMAHPKYSAWYDDEEARKVQLKQQNEDSKDMYTSERKEAMYSQVAELHQQQQSSETKTEHHSESKSNQTKQYSESKSSSASQVITTSSSKKQQQQLKQSSQQQSSEEQMTEWQKVALKEKKHVQYAQASHFDKVRKRL